MTVILTYKYTMLTRTRRKVGTALGLVLLSSFFRRLFPFVVIHLQKSTTISNIQISFISQKQFKKESYLLTSVFTSKNFNQHVCTQSRARP